MASEQRLEIKENLRISLQQETLVNVMQNNSSIFLYGDRGSS
ncbi:hypothetical protein [Fructilactobacillus florum]|nr:hypothetical protein [Fructilactobacillus florum]